MAVKHKFWGEHDITPDKTFFYKTGTLNLWFKRHDDELQIACRHERENEKIPSEPPEDITWSRWVFKRADTKIRLIPAFPDRSVVVKPDHPFRIIRNASAKIYVRVPLWIRIELATRKGELLTEIPSVILSKTWFGSMTEGEHCYWISTSARRQIEPDISRPYSAICPVRITNKTDTDLNFEKLSLNGGHLSIFIHEGQLWSDEITINYRGPQDISRIQVTGKPPGEAPDAELLSPPKISDKKSFARKTFHSLTELPGFGFLKKNEE